MDGGEGGRGSNATTCCLSVQFRLDWQQLGMSWTRVCNPNEWFQAKGGCVGPRLMVFAGTRQRESGQSGRQALGARSVISWLGKGAWHQVVGRESGLGEPHMFGVSGRAGLSRVESSRVGGLICALALLAFWCGQSSCADRIQNTAEVCVLA